jgi:hypothetical protein
MTHWYREPKQIRLIEHLERAGIDFVLCSFGFSDIDLQKLKAGLPPIKLAQRLTVGTPDVGDGTKALIVARPDRIDPDWLRNPEPWAGLLVLPSQSAARDRALQEIFAVNRSFPNGARGRRAVSKGILRRFVLDMTATPPSLYGVREAPSSQGLPLSSRH